MASFYEAPNDLVFSITIYCSIGEISRSSFIFSDVSSFFTAKLFGDFDSHLEGLECLMVIAHTLNHSDALKLMNAIHGLQIPLKRLDLTIFTATLNATVLQSTTLNYNVILRQKNPCKGMISSNYFLTFEIKASFIQRHCY